MPIRYLTGDATDPDAEGVKIIVHCCNNVGAWGAGFVMALSRKWEEPEREYRKWAHTHAGSLPLGQVQFVAVGSKIVVANLIGQNGLRSPHHTSPVNYGAISTGMGIVAEKARVHGASIHMPRMGCGLAGGSWRMIESILEETVGDLSVTVYDLP